MFAGPLHINLFETFHSLAGDAFVSCISFYICLTSVKIVLAMMGSETMTQVTNFVDEAFFLNEFDYLQPRCSSNSQFSIPLQLGSATLQQARIVVEVGNFLQRREIMPTLLKYNNILYNRECEERSPRRKMFCST